MHGRATSVCAALNALAVLSPHFLRCKLSNSGCGGRRNTENVSNCLGGGGEGGGISAGVRHPRMRLLRPQTASHSFHYRFDLETESRAAARGAHVADAR